MNSKTIIQIATAAIVILLIGGCSNSIKEQKGIIKYVKVEKVSTHNENDKLVFNGTIKEQNLTTLSFRVGGPLVGLVVVPGDFVKKGEIIASIDKRDYQLQLEARKAQYIQLKGEFERYKELFNKKKIPANSYEKIESGYLMAKTAYENAQNQLRDTDLIAPFSGYIHEKKTENFQTVGPGQAIVSVIDISNLEVVISIPENLLSKIRNSTNNLLSVQNSGVSNLPLSVVSINEKTGKDGMYQMKFNFINNPSLHISPGMSAEVTMLCNLSTGRIKIPSSAIFHKKEKTYVWIFNKKSELVNKQEVTISKLSNGGLIEVVRGLNSDQTIVTAGVHYLFEGQEVHPIHKSSKSNVGGLL
jgi:RND family efflux transporter MFP subunit